MTEPNSFHVEIEVTNGRPDGLRIVQKSGWVGLGLICPRSSYLKIKGDPELSNSGVYILIGSDKDFGLPMIYVGQAETVRDRLNNHHANKEFWQQAIVFTRQGRTPLNKSEVQYLESRLVEIARSSSRCKLDNGNMPNRPGLSEADKKAAEDFLEEMLLLLPVLGVCHFEVQDEKTTLTKRMYSCRSGDLLATGYESNSGGFVVKKGSQAKGSINDSMESGVSLRADLIKMGILVKKGEHYVFTKDYEFKTPTPASSIVQGRQAPGPVSWKDQRGVTLKEHRIKESE